MSEPTKAAYEAAAQTAASLGWAGSKPETWTVDEVAVRAIVDAVWPLAVAEGRRQAAEAIRAQVTANAVPPVALRSGAILRANSVAEWAAGIAEGAHGG
jgi:hypothetical protein